MAYCIRQFHGAFKNQHNNISTRQMKNFDHAVIVNDLLGVDWHGISRSTNGINVVVNNWAMIFSLI